MGQYVCLRNDLLEAVNVHFFAARPKRTGAFHCKGGSAQKQGRLFLSFHHQLSSFFSQLVISHTIAYPEVICCESEERTRVVLDVARKLQLPYVTFAAATIRDLCWCVRSIYNDRFLLCTLSDPQSYGHGYYIFIVYFYLRLSGRTLSTTQFG